MIVEQGSGTSDPHNQFLSARVVAQVSISEMHSARNLTISMTGTTRYCKIPQGQFRVDYW